VERSGIFSDLAGRVAGQAGVPFIPIREMAADQYEILGPVRVRDLFPERFAPSRCLLLLCW
jgi:hypothetical protein